MSAEPSIAPMKLAPTANADEGKAPATEIVKATQAEVAPESAAPVEATPVDAKPVKAQKIKAPKRMQPGFRPVLIMGYGVLVPLVAMAMVVVMSYPANGVSNVLKVEITYAAALLSFLAGIRWGVALMAGGEHLRFRPLAAVTLMLPFAWVTIFLTPPVALGLLMVGYLVLAMSEREGDESPVPGWYRALLRPFTILVEVALGLTLLIILNF
ncbi:MAG: DUF3429 domain-containing protein [Parvibaculum sp.]